MNISDVSGAIFIILVFFSFYFINYVIIQGANIRKHWNDYKCNPMIMPFAGFFGHSTEQTFEECTQNVQSNSMAKFLEPLHFNLNVLGETNKLLGDSINGVGSYLSNLRIAGGGVFKTIFGVIFNVFVQFQKLGANIEDLFSKLFAIFVSFIYILNSSIFTMQSTWAGPPGEAVRFALCFDPNTKIKTQNGELISMKDISLNTKLKNGGSVYVVMNISNISENGEHMNEIYEIDGGENGDKIYVTGSHLIYDKEIKEYVFVRESKFAKITKNKCDNLACLITSDHIIPIGDHIFHDWDDDSKNEL